MAQVPVEGHCILTSSNSAFICEQETLSAVMSYCGSTAIRQIPSFLSGCRTIFLEFRANENSNAYLGLAPRWEPPERVVKPIGQVSRLSQVLAPCVLLVVCSVLRTLWYLHGGSLFQEKHARFEHIDQREMRGGKE